MLSNKETQNLLEQGSVHIDGIRVHDNCLLPENAEIKVNGKTERAKKDYVYFKFHKPVGFESTLNRSIEKNLSPFFEGYDGLAIAGRLDKQSQGLLLVSNDGKWVERMCNPKFEKEKEYLVTLDKTPGAGFLKSFGSGVDIWNYITAPCFCEPLQGNQVRVILKEGKNRQIRRMCKALGYEVISLERIRIDSLFLADLKEGDKENFELQSI